MDKDKIFDDVDEDRRPFLGAAAGGEGFTRLQVDLATPREEPAADLSIFRKTGIRFSLRKCDKRKDAGAGFCFRPP
jgi:hypothetical protein